MAKGKNFLVQQTVKSFAHIFTQAGMVRSEDTWALGPFGCLSTTHIPNPQATKKEIEQLVQGDIDTGKANQIAYICIRSDTAVNLFLGGTLTEQHFEKAIEVNDTIIIEGVQFLDRLFKVVILEKVNGEDWMYSAATMTAQGEIIV